MAHSIRMSVVALRLSLEVQVVLILMSIVWCRGGSGGEVEGRRSQVLVWRHLMLEVRRVGSVNCEYVSVCLLRWSQLKF